MLSRTLLGASLLVVVLLAGCGGNSPRAVTGTVTFRGKPIPEGDIIFLDSADKLAPDAGKISNGTFTFKAKQGSKKVQIRASRLEKLPGGKKGAMGETETPVEYIPSRYNNETKLTAEVTPNGPNTFEFKLEK